jgi:hypothetical protein
MVVGVDSALVIPALLAAFAYPCGYTLFPVFAKIKGFGKNYTSRRQKAEGKRQKAEDRRQKVKGKRQKAEDRRQKVKGKRQKAEDRRRKAEGFYIYY